MSRKIYNMNEWLINPEFAKMQPGEYSALQLKIFGLFVKNFFSTDIYEDMIPNEFAKRTIMNPLYIESNNISKVVILSRNITDTQRESKERFIKRYFTNPKIEVVSVPASGKKGDFLKEMEIPFDMFIDDELQNIRNVAEVFKSLAGKEFLIPEYGYNKMLPDVQALIEEKGGVFTYYNPFKK